MWVYKKNKQQMLCSSNGQINFNRQNSHLLNALIVKLTMKQMQLERVSGCDKPTENDYPNCGSALQCILMSLTSLF